MKRLAFATAFGVVALGLAGCTDNDAAVENTAAAEESTGTSESTGGTETAAATGFPRGSRIVEEDGVTFRVDADGTRIQLGPTDSRIIVEDDIRYRVDPDGTRVRIGPDGAEFTVDGGDVDANVDTSGPSLKVETN